MIPPLAADLASAVEQITAENTEVGGKAGAFGQAFPLLNCGISSAGVLAGPSLAGFLHDAFGWRVMGWTLAILSASGVVPIVGSYCCCINAIWPMLIPYRHASQAGGEAVEEN